MCTVQAKRSGFLLLDPATSEESQSEATCTMALMPSSNEVTQLEMQGEATTRQIAVDGAGLPLDFHLGYDPEFLAALSYILPVSSSPSVALWRTCGSQGRTCGVPLRPPVLPCLISCPLIRVLGRQRVQGGAGALHGGLLVHERSHARSSPTGCWINRARDHSVQV